jgi:hypothetical protein
VTASYKVTGAHTINESLNVTTPTANVPFVTSEPYSLTKIDVQTGTVITLLVNVSVSGPGGLLGAAALRGACSVLRRAVTSTLDTAIAQLNSVDNSIHLDGP